MELPGESATTVEARSYRAGVFAGMVAFIAFLGLVKDIYALLDPAGRGQMAWGFVILRYSSLQPGSEPHTARLACRDAEIFAGHGPYAPRKNGAFAKPEASETVKGVR